MSTVSFRVSTSRIDVPAEKADELARRLERVDPGAAEAIRRGMQAGVVWTPGQKEAAARTIRDWRRRSASSAPS